MRWLVVVVCGILLPGLAWAAELSTEHRRLVESVNAAVVEAGKSYAGGQFEAAGKHISKAIDLLDKAGQSGSPDLYDQLLPAMRRIQKAHTLLEFEGVSLQPFEVPRRPVPASTQPGGAKPGGAKPRGGTPTKGPMPTAPPTSTPEPDKKPTPPKPEPKPNPPSADTMISFTKTVAPILVSRCGRCHVSDSKGGFNTASYSALMKGPPEGVVIFAGDTVGSRLIETIESGDMPRGGGRVTAQELQTLKAWILSGAKFDGTDPEAPIAGGTSPPPVNMNVEVRRATGNETVSFALDVAPLLVDNCNGCHIDAMRTRGGLRMDTMAQLLRGGDSGPIVVPGKGSESLLVQKLRGMAGARMPGGGRPALPEEAIELISTWIDEGATLDGASATQPLRVMSQLAWAAAATPEEMSERRSQLAASNLSLVTASSAPAEPHHSDHFLVTGPVSSETLKLVADLAEEQMKTVRTVIKDQGGEAFYHGKATIFVFPKRYDYSEFAKMVETRSVPNDWTSHWGFNGIDAYVSLVCSQSDEDDVITARLTSPLVSLAVATRAIDVPRWLAEGAGAATAYRLANARDRNARRQQEADIYDAVASMENAKQFLDGKLPPEQSDRIGAAIVSTMLERNYRRVFDAMIRNLQEDKSFKQSFQEAFGGDPNDFVTAWIKSVRGG